MRALLSFGLLALIAHLACSEQAGLRPNLVLITLDTLRADRLGAYGYERDTSPVLDSIASRGLRFDDAIAQATTTPPSHASILTGLNPARHGLRKLYGQRLPDANQTLAEILRAEGYATAAFVSAVPLRHTVGLDQGFEVYGDEWEPEAGEIPHDRDARLTNAQVRSWLESAPRSPVFLWVHYFDPHHPYFPPEAYRKRFGVEKAKRDFLPIPRNTNRWRPGNRPVPRPNEKAARKMSNLYDAEIAYLDEALGELLQSLRAAGILENAVVAYVGDHGEHLGENGYWFGHWDVLDETARVPMVIAHPDGRHAGRVVEETVGTIDLVPTLLSWLGVDTDLSFDGVDLTGRLEGGEPARRVLYTEQFEYFPVRAVRSGEWMLQQRAKPKAKIASGERTLYRRKPSGEEPSPVDDEPDVRAWLSEALDSLVAPATRRTTEKLAVPEEVRERLRALGYSDEARGPDG
ncbi:MAG: sulfatase [Myxococcota bacterium]|nr:sulfatase [Myxococcota bacterium]